MRSVAALLFIVLWPAIASSQDLSPRAFWPAPKGTNVFAIAYQHSRGDVLTDPSLPVSGVDSRINAGQLTYQRTVSLFNRTSNIQFRLPYIASKTEGLVDGQYRQRELAGLGDAQMVLSVNLRGAPSMDLAGFQALRKNPRTIVGASIAIGVPTGAYDSDRLINAGANRWSSKATIGVIWPMRPTWMFEAYAGAAFFGNNDAYLNRRQEQDPVKAVELHLVKLIRSDLWVSLDWTYYEGGQTTVDGDSRYDMQQNSRAGITFVQPFKRGHAVRASFSSGLNVASGGDFDSLTVSYLYAW